MSQISNELAEILAESESILLQAELEWILIENDPERLNKFEEKSVANGGQYSVLRMYAEMMNVCDFESWFENEVLILVDYDQRARSFMNYFEVTDEDMADIETAKSILTDIFDLYTQREYLTCYGLDPLPILVMKPEVGQAFLSTMIRAEMDLIRYGNPLELETKQPLKCFYPMPEPMNMSSE